MIAWIALAVSLVALAVSLRSRKGGDAMPIALMLGRECVVTIGNHSYLANCVAVSWKGNIAVRGQMRTTRKVRWIRRSKVKECIRWI